MASRLALLAIMGLATTTAFAAPVRQTDAALRVQHYVDGLTSLRAEFRQLVSDARGRVIERAEGTMALSRPGRFRWDYRVPLQLIVSDGQTVWLYDVDLAQVTIRPAGEAFAGTPAMLLAGGGNLADEFTITDAGRDEELAWNLLVPRRADADFREVRLGFAGPELRRMVMLDRLGQTTDLEFLQVERNPRLDASLFSFEPPAGVDVVGRAQGH